MGSSRSRANHTIARSAYSAVFGSIRYFLELARLAL
jgi:hypothetical protein